MRGIKHINHKEVSGRVKNILTDFPESRNSDAILFYRYIVRYHAAPTNIPFVIAMMNQRYPNYGTVERVRRKLQRQFPELRADKNVEAMRMMKEEEFREYARAVN